MLTALVGLSLIAPLPTLAAPVRLESGGAPIETDIGHPDPWVYDYDRDGKKDLLVGQFGDGKLRIYLNKGTDAAPKFDGYTYLSVSGKDASVPPS